MEAAAGCGAEHKLSNLPTRTMVASRAKTLSMPWKRCRLDGCRSEDSRHYFESEPGVAAHHQLRVSAIALAGREAASYDGGLAGRGDRKLAGSMRSVGRNAGCRRWQRSRQSTDFALFVCS